MAPASRLLTIDQPSAIPLVLSRDPTLRRTLLILLPALALFTWGALSAITVPGIYMDAVNPDFLVLPLLHPGAQLPDWTLPGTLLLGRFPLLGQLYHGVLPFYLGLPVYAALGTGIPGIRAANLLFGLLVLAAMAAFLLAFRVRPALAALCLAALALDPGFLFSFRTQLYITLLPTAPLLAAIALTERRRSRPTLQLLAGLLAGLACYGYFIYAFTLPVLAIHARRRHPSLSRWWTTGLLLGLAPYPVALLLILGATGSLPAFIAFIVGNLHALAIHPSPTPALPRLAYFAQMVQWTINGVGPATMMLQARLPLALPLAKSILLLALPAPFLLLALLRPGRLPGLAIIAGLCLSSAALFLTFGDRLWLHHAIPLLPLLYAALALTLEAACTVLPRAAPFAAIPIAVLLAGNAIDRHAMFAALRQTGGVALASDALTHFAQDAAHDPTPTAAFFPDWGVFTSFAMLTGGRIPIHDTFPPAQARQALCAGRDVLVADLHPASGRLATWTAQLAWTPPSQAPYLQRDGTPVLMALRWHATPAPPGACPPEAPLR